MSDTSDMQRLIIRLRSLCARISYKTHLQQLIKEKEYTYRMVYIVTNIFARTHTHTHTHTHVRLRAFFSGTTRVSRYQKGKNQSGIY